MSLVVTLQRLDDTPGTPRPPTCQMKSGGSMATESACKSLLPLLSVAERIMRKIDLQASGQLAT